MSTTTNRLSEIEVSLIEAFYNNEPMREAVRKVLLAGIYENGVIGDAKQVDPRTNWVLSHVYSDTPPDDAQLGRLVRANAEGIMTVESAFKEMSGVKTKVVADMKTTNPAL